jgi:lysophospholipase
LADFIRISSNPPPPEAEVFDFTGAGGRLRAAHFPAKPARALAVLLAGRVEFLEKYFEVIGELNARGFSVATMDWRGQGQSERLLDDPIKGHISDFAVYRCDLRRFVEEVARIRFSGPLILMTHSMGGTPALQLLADGYDAFAAAVLCAPLTRIYGGPAMRLYARVASYAASAAGFANQSVPGVKEHSLEFAGNILTSDPARHRRFLDLQRARPEAVIRNPTFGWVKAAIAAMDDLHRPERFARLKTPVLIVSAERDQLIDSSDHAVLAARSALIEHVVIKGALHEVMMERDELRRVFWTAVDAFLERALAAGRPRLATAEQQFC